MHLTVKVVINLFDATKFDARNSNFRALYLPIIYHASPAHISIIDKLNMKMNIAAFALKFQISRVIEVLHFTSIIHDATLKLQTFYRFFRTYLQLEQQFFIFILHFILDISKPMHACSNR